jgi:DNA repair exonuclease SbcCD ATPase subunit
MKFTTIEMKGIRQFTHKRIDFADGLNIVYGPNESGKSTILDSLVACVLKPTEKEKSSLIQWNSPYSEIKLTYTTDTGTFTLTRVLHPGEKEKDLLEGDACILEDPEEIQDILEEHIGFTDRALFETSIVVKQNEMQILQEEGSRAKIRNKVRSLISGVPERPTDEALEFLEKNITSAESFLEETEKRVTSIENELHNSKEVDGHLKDLKTKLTIYVNDLKRDQSILSGYGMLLQYREAETEYIDLTKTLEMVENYEAYMRKLPIREKELTQSLQEELGKISAHQDKLIEKKKMTREELQDMKVRLSAIDDELEEVSPEKENILSKISSLFKKSSRARKEEMAARRVEISQNVARLEDLFDRLDEEISEWRRKFQEKGERLQQLLEQCGEYEHWSVEKLEDRRKEYESKIEEILKGMTREDMEEKAESKRREADDLRANLVKEHPDLKDRIDVERISIEKEKLAEIIVEWEEKIAGLKAQVELQSSQAEKREALIKELETLKEERKEKNLQMKADKIAHDVITLVYQDLKEKFAPELERRAEKIWGRITQGRYLDITVRREDLDVLIQVPEKEEPITVDVLSQGTRDQLYLSLRIALSELLSGDKNPPLLFDEAFYTFDDDRLQEALIVLREISQTTQIIVFTHDKAYAEHGYAIPLKKLG